MKFMVNSLYFVKKRVILHFNNHIRNKLEEI
jgi:hypothetical protein